MSRSLFVLSSAALLTLAACSQQQWCIDRSMVETRRLSRLIAESEANLARGYRIEEITIMRHSWEPCGFRSDGRHEMCFEPDEDTITRNVPIDPAAEQRTLDNLKAKQASLAKPVASAVAECKRAYPE